MDRIRSRRFEDRISSLASSIDVCHGRVVAVVVAQTQACRIRDRLQVVELLRLAHFYPPSRKLSRRVAADDVVGTLIAWSMRCLPVSLKKITIVTKWKAESDD